MTKKVIGDGKTVDRVRIETFVGPAYVAEHEGIVGAGDAAEIRRCSGTQFDPDIAEVWLKVMAEDVNYELREQIAEDTPHAS